MEVFRDTFDPEAGTVEVVLRNKRVRVKARNITFHTLGDAIALDGFYGSYRTSAKLWPAKVTLWADGRLTVNFGRDDRSGRYNKMDGLVYKGDEL